MRKYLGSAFAAIVSPCFIVFPVVLMMLIIRESNNIDAATILLCIMCISGSIMWGNFVWKQRKILYVWGYFQPCAVYVKILFNKTFPIYYDQCKSCGIAYYRHAFMNNTNSILGSDLYFIYLSLDTFNEKYRNNINLWIPSQNRIKVKFNKELYEQLLLWLPQKQADMLIKDYIRYFDNKI